MSGKKWGIVSAVAAGCVLAAVMLLCMTKKQTMVEAEPAQTVLPVLIAGGDASWENCMRGVAASYMEEHPEVKVQVTATMNRAGSDYIQGLLVEDALGNFNGIVEMKNTESFAQEEKIIPLPQDITDLVQTPDTYEGKIYAVPRFYTGRGIIYNKKIFEKLNLEVPKTYQEFLAVCENLKLNGIKPLTVGAADSWHLKNWIDGLFTNDVKQKIPNWIELRNEGKVHWTDEETMKMLTELQQLFIEGDVEENYLTTTDGGTIEVLTEGKAAMLYSGTWMFSQITKADSQFEIGWFFLPRDEGEPIVEYDGTWGLSITSSCAKQPKVYQTALDFLKFYYSKNVYKKVLQSMNSISSLKEEIDYSAIDVQKDIMQQVKEKGVQQKGTLGLSETPEGFMMDLYANILKLAEGQQNVRETAEILDESWDENLEENR